MAMNPPQEKVREPESEKNLWTKDPKTDAWVSLFRELSKDQPLFGRLEWDSVRQQGLTNCPLPASLAALARVDPGRIQQMIRRDEKTYYSYFVEPWSRQHYYGEKIYRVHFHNSEVLTVTDRIYFRGKSGSANTWFSKSTDGGAWLSLLEKAYVAYRGDFKYENLDFLNVAKPLTTEQVFFDVVGPFDKIGLDGAGNPDIYTDHNGRTSHGNETYETGRLKEYLSRAPQRATIATTDRRPTHPKLVGLHTYVVDNLNSKNDNVRVFDPMRATSHDDIPYRDFFEAGFDGLYQARS